MIGLRMFLRRKVRQINEIHSRFNKTTMAADFRLRLPCKSYSANWECNVTSETQLCLICFLTWKLFSVHDESAPLNCHSQYQYSWWLCRLSLQSAYTCCTHNCSRSHPSSSIESMLRLSTITLMNIRDTLAPWIKDFELRLPLLLQYARPLDPRAFSSIKRPTVWNECRGN